MDRVHPAYNKTELPENENLISDDSDIYKDGYGNTTLIRMYSSKNSCFSFAFWVIVFVLLAMLLMMESASLSLAIQDRAKGVSGKYSWKDCGSSAEEARKLGCVYDIMMNGWVRKECYNQELSEQHIQDGNFRFYYDREGKNEMPYSILRRGDHHHMWTNDLHHRSHCVYVWKVQALALEGQAANQVIQISNESMSLEHTMHCSGILLNSRPEPPFSMNYGEVAFLTCGPYLS